MAGCSIPATVRLLGPRVRHVVVVACTVPEHGMSILDTLDPAIQEMVRSVPVDAEPAAMDPEMAKIVLGGCDVVDIDAGHMCMVSQPAETAAVITCAARR